MRTRLILLGTQGGPNFNPIRAETSSAVVVDGEIYLVDCGYGAMAAVRKAGLIYRNIANIFLAHLHDDHTGDLAALLSHQWTDGRIAPTTVYGPFGTERLVEAALAFGRANTEIRLVDEARTVEPEDIFSGRDLEATGQPIKVYEDAHVTVTSIENTHFPEITKRKTPHRSLSYRFDTTERSIAFSGDTAYSSNLVELARDADVLVCEVMHVSGMRRAFDIAVAAGAYADNAEGIWRHIAGTHTSTEDAGRMAAEAGVGTLVLNHLVPGSLMEIGDAAYIEGVRKAFDGEIVVGQDLMDL